MDITSTESCAIDTGYNYKENDAEFLRQNVNSLLQKNLNLKIRRNLTKDERSALKELWKGDKLRVHEFDKGCGFANVTDDMSKEKKEEQLGKARKAKKSPTNKFTNKTNIKLCELRKENEFTNKISFELYPFYPIPPCLYGTIKAHKPKNTFPCES